MSTTPKSFATILNDSVALAQSLLLPLLIGAVIFGLLTAAVNTWTVKSSVSDLVSQSEKFQNNMEDLNRKIEDVNKRMAAGDTSALEELAANPPVAVPTAADMAAVSTAMKSLPTIVGGMILMILISIVAQAYGTVVIIRKVTDPTAAFSSFGESVMPLTLLWIWMMIRSFVWIPFIGWIIALVIGPRFVAAPIFLIEEKKGITESVRLSLKATTGAWWRIVLPCVIAGVVGAIAAGIVSGVLSVFGFLGVILAAVVSQFVAYWVLATGVVVARDVLTHPSAKVINA